MCPTLRSLTIVWKSEPYYRGLGTDFFERLGSVLRTFGGSLGELDLTKMKARGTLRRYIL